ncbi:hypothetical protein NLC35_03850 [Candidatus Aminicenantes bacterium AC-334-K16]|jgi:protein-S-isoprenylcysteine O-methyltransferase Ste14|nr:hypothetical protein [Candidatus Aminicenantes bacterium AC-334-K16]
MAEKKVINLLYRWRVRVGSLGLVVALIFAAPTGLSLLAGLVICFLGLGLRAWACGHLEKDKALTISGPYRFTRNPLYLGNLIIGLSVVIAARSMVVLSYFLFYFLLFYPVIISYEKQKMKQIFPEDYHQFENQVPLFFPSLKPALPRNNRRFQWSLYQKNRELRAVGAALIFWALLLSKMLFL